MSIRKLPPLLINQIAAGEVIERPASVVKELVENSLDAGATQINVQIEEGGHRLIRVHDNGQGICESELPLALASHATSKITEAQQLHTLRTMGFRGEALASIASISHLTITSRATRNGKVAESGATLKASGHQRDEVEPAGCSPGTVIIVRDLFFNTPARLKFMRSASTEFGYIHQTLTRIAMVRPDVGFHLTHNDRKIMDLAVEPSHRRRCVQILGKQLDDALLELEHSQPPHEQNPNQEPPRLWALVGLPSLAKATSRFQYLFVNGRPITDRNLSHAIKEAYRGLIPPDRHPLAVVCLQIDPSDVDINVHPAKSQVRFREPSRMHGLILHAIRQKLLASDLTPAVTFSSNSLPTHSFISSGDGSRDGNPHGRNAGNGSGTLHPATTGQTSQATGPPSTRQFIDHFKQMGSSEKGIVYQQVKQALADSHDASLLENPGIDAWEQAQRHSPGGAPATPLLQKHGVLQVHHSYLVTQDEQGIVIIDQHALHERIMFEKLRERILGQKDNLESQRLLVPAVLPASIQRMDFARQLEPLFQRIGMEVDPIGKDSLAIHAFPTLLFDRKVEPITFLNELLDLAQEGQLDLSNPGLDEAVLHKVLDMMACKAAVKAGDDMTQEELAALLEQREATERASNCPHGRPTSVRLSLKDLEKQFMRT